MSSTSKALNTLNVVSQQVQNLLNAHVTKYINTGDRVVDNGIILIIHSCFALVGAYLYTAIIKLATYVYDYYIIKRKRTTDDPLDIDYDNFDYSKWSTDTIAKYTHVLPNISRSTLEKWFTAKNINPNYTKQTTYDRVSNGNIREASFEFPSYFMPMWKYKTAKNEYEYVWLIESKLYSNNVIALKKLYIEIYNNGQPSTNKQTRDLISITEGNVKRIGHVNKNKIFDNMYFHDKPALINMLDKFKAGNMFPNALCDNKLGVLLYGPPGTGKTGTISAIANYLRRHIIMMHDTSAGSIASLKSEISSNIDGIKEYVIVFDEFDHILCDNQNEAAKYMKEYKLSKLREQLRDETDKDERQDLKDQIADLQNNDDVAIGMGELLRFLDGMEDQSGRLIIATTNYPNKINPRLLRPGRFDLKLELGYCTLQMFCGIIHNKFPDDIDRISELVHTCAIVASATVEATSNKNNNVTTVEIAQTTTVPMQQHITRLLEKKITPIDVIISCVKANTFAELVDILDSLEPDTFTYSK